MSREMPRYDLTSANDRYFSKVAEKGNFGERCQREHYDREINGRT